MVHHLMICLIIYLDRKLFYYFFSIMILGFQNLVLNFQHSSCNTPLVTHKGYYQNSSHQTYTTQEM
jgi:hypothetical protein